MPSKLSYEYIRNFIEENSNGECKLISKDYVNSSEKLLLQCKCGEYFECTFAKIKSRKKFSCNKCSKLMESKKLSFDLDYVKEKAKEYNCEYVSGEYKNNYSKMTFRCSCGNLFVRDLPHLIRSNTCLECSKKRTVNSKIKYDICEAKKILESVNLQLLNESEYKDSCSYITCKCKNNHIFKTKLTYILNGKGKKRYYCEKCYRELNVGTNSNKYTSGNALLIECLRGYVENWRENLLLKSNYTCYVTNSKENLVVHHLISFSTLINQTFVELNLDKKKTIGYYSNDEIAKIRKLLLEKHMQNVGVVITKDIHKQFHSQYGIGNNTKEQFNEFLANNFPNTKLID